MDRAIESVFAEYQKELLKEFEVFGLEGSYESGNYSEERVIERLAFYGASGMDNKIQAIRFLTDEEGKFFREQAARYMESKYGLDIEGRLETDTGLWEKQTSEMQELGTYAKTQELNLENLMAGSETELPAEDNPIANVKHLANRPLVELVMPEGKNISEGVLPLSEMPSHREQRQGYGTFTVRPEEKAIGTLGFGAYLAEQFHTAADEPDQGNQTLQYEAEYILGGTGSDKENLNKVIKKLLLIRMASNYTFVAENPEKRAEAEAMALGLATVVLLPEIAGAITQVLLLSWAFGESIVDIRALLEGKKIPLIKTSDTWQLSLSSVSKLGTAADQVRGEDCASGLSYKEYLQILLFAQEKTSGAGTVTMRTLDMVEKRLRYDLGSDWFRIDNCISKLEIKSTCNLRRGITYQFGTYFGYQ